MMKQFLEKNVSKKLRIFGILGAVSTLVATFSTTWIFSVGMADEFFPMEDPELRAAMYRFSFEGWGGLIAFFLVICFAILVASSIYAGEIEKLEAIMKEKQLSLEGGKGRPWYILGTILFYAITIFAILGLFVPQLTTITMMSGYLKEAMDYFQGKALLVNIIGTIQRFCIGGLVTFFCIAKAEESIVLNYRHDHSEEFQNKEISEV